MRLSSLFARWQSWRNPSVLVGQHGFEARARGRQIFVRFDDICTVGSEKISKIAYDELFLIIHKQDGSSVTVGELDDNFQYLDRALHERLAGFPANWWVIAEQAPVGTAVQLWPGPEGVKPSQA